MHQQTGGVEGLSNYRQPLSSSLPNLWGENRKTKSRIKLPRQFGVKKVLHSRPEVREGWMRQQTGGVESLSRYRQPLS